MVRRILVVVGAALVGTAMAMPAGAATAGASEAPQFTINYNQGSATISAASITPCPLRAAGPERAAAPVVHAEIFLINATGQVLASSTSPKGLNSFVDPAGNWVASMNVSGVEAPSTGAALFVGADCFTIGTSTGKGSKGKNTILRSYAFDNVTVFSRNVSQ